MRVAVVIDPQSQQPIEMDPAKAKVLLERAELVGMPLEHVRCIHTEGSGCYGQNGADDVAAEQDAFYDKALEGFTMFALNQGEICTCPSRALVQQGMYEQFVGDAVKRVEAITQGNPLDTETTMGAQASNDQFEKIKSYLAIGREEGAKVLTGGDKAEGRATCDALLRLCNREAVELEIDDGATVVVQAGQAPVVNGQREERMRVGCGSATIGMFASQWHGLVDEVVDSAAEAVAARSTSSGS